MELSQDLAQWQILKSEILNRLLKQKLFNITPFLLNTILYFLSWENYRVIRCKQGLILIINFASRRYSIVFIALEPHKGNCREDETSKNLVNQFNTDNIFWSRHILAKPKIVLNEKTTCSSIEYGGLESPL
jgi:hypothetical protein